MISNLKKENKIFTKKKEMNALSGFEDAGTVTVELSIYSLISHQPLDCIVVFLLCYLTKTLLFKWCSDVLSDAEI